MPANGVRLSASDDGSFTQTERHQPITLHPARKLPAKAEETDRSHFHEEARQPKAASSDCQEMSQSLLIQTAFECLWQDEQADQGGQTCNQDGVPQAVINVP